MATHRVLTLADLQQISPTDLKRMGNFKQMRVLRTTLRSDLVYPVMGSLMVNDTTIRATIGQEGGQTFQLDLPVGTFNRLQQVEVGDDEED